MSENMQYFSFWAWLISLNMMISSSIFFPANNTVSFFMWIIFYVNNYPPCIYITFFLSVHWLLGTYADSITWLLWIVLW
jgi:hypothetical protein